MRRKNFRTALVGGIAVVVGGLATGPVSASANSRGLDPTAPLALEVSGPAAGFGIDGVATVPGGSADDVLVAPDGALVVVAVDTTAEPTTVSVSRLDAAGRPDPAFGTGGTVSAARPGLGHADDLTAAVDGAGRVLLASVEERQGMLDIVVRRLLPDGTVDTTFGGGEVARPMMSEISDMATVTDVAVGPTGDVVVGGVSTRIDPNAGTQGHIAAIGRFSDTGEEVGSVMVSTSPRPRAEGLVIDHLAVDASGRVLHVEGRGGTLSVRRYTPSLVLDASFGWKGVKVLRAAEMAGGLVQPTALRTGPDGIFLGITAVPGSGNAPVDVVALLAENGLPRWPWFGGWIDPTSLAGGGGPVADLAVHPDGGAFLVGTRTDGRGWVRHLVPTAAGGSAGAVFDLVGMVPVAVAVVDDTRLVVVGTTEAGIEVRAFDLEDPAATSTDGGADDPVGAVDDDTVEDAPPASDGDTVDGDDGAVVPAGVGATDPDGDSGPT